jgi:NAD(P)-dependent dehydrogenase (short-subunit alcohol dehydrogenase family)
MRLKDRIAIVVGAGQSPGEGIGNGRATALTFAREGAKVLCVDHNLASAQETVDMIGGNQGTAVAFKADVTKEAEIKAHGRRHARALGPHRHPAQQCRRQPVRRRRRTARHHRGGARSLRGDQPQELHLRRPHVIPIMRAQKSGAIINISSMAVITTYPYVAYKATKAAMVSFTEQLAYQNAQYGIRANVILPGLMNTPMAVDTRARDVQEDPRRGRGRARRPGAAAQEDGHRLGRRQCRACSWPRTRPTSSPA